MESSCFVSPPSHLNLHIQLYWLQHKPVETGVREGYVSKALLGSAQNSYWTHCLHQQNRDTVRVRSARVDELMTEWPCDTNHAVFVLYVPLRYNGSMRYNGWILPMLVLSIDYRMSTVSVQYANTDSWGSFSSPVIWHWIHYATGYLLRGSRLYTYQWRWTSGI